MPESRLLNLHALRADILKDMYERNVLSCCDFCGEDVLASDRLSRPFANGSRRHWECDLRMIVGGANRVRGLHDLPEDPPELSRRDAARLAVVAYRERAGRDSDQVIEEVIDLRFDILEAAGDDDAEETRQ